MLCMVANPCLMQRGAQRRVHERCVRTQSSAVARGRAIKNSQISDVRFRGRNEWDCPNRCEPSWAGGGRPGFVPNLSEL
jgi:hypothetical protein